MYKVFLNILLQKIIHMLDFHQSREQAGFRAGHSIIDHLHAVNYLQKEGSRVKHSTLFPFVDYEKAVNIDLEQLFKVLKNQGVE